MVEWFDPSPIEPFNSARNAVTQREPRRRQQLAGADAGRVPGLREERGAAGASSALCGEVRLRALRADKDVLGRPGLDDLILLCMLLFSACNCIRRSIP